MGLFPSEPSGPRKTSRSKGAARPRAKAVAGKAGAKPPEVEAAPATATPSPGSARPLRVSELCTLIDQALRVGVKSPVRVVGEVSNFRDRTHWWFALKDEAAVVDCVMFAAAARRAMGGGLAPSNGMSVVATGRIEHYAPQGRTQLYVDRLEPVGVGALEQRFRALCEELRRLGYFDAARKKPLPWFPRRIAVVTSRTGAALQDVLDTMRRRCPAVEIALVDVRVQGDGAADEIAHAIRYLSARREALGVDAILLTRGGGSMEDLWAFNERALADAILECEAPIIAAIGHETDTTIAELVADERAATPTQAAMRLTPDREALLQQLATAQRRLQILASAALHRHDARLRSLDPSRAVMVRIHRARARVEQAGARLARVRPEAVYAARHGRLDDASRRLREAIGRRLTAVNVTATRETLDASWKALVSARAQSLGTLTRALELASPRSVLGRGYSMTFRADGALVREPSDVRPGDALLTHLRAGRVRSIVDGASAGAHQVTQRPPSIEPARPKRSAARAAEEPEHRPQMDLFSGGE